MAVRGSLSTPHIISHQSALFRKPVFGMVVLRRSQLRTKKTSILQIRSSKKDQVFEDRSNGIVCYKDDNGEIICEGFDEGPRFYPQCPITPSLSRDVSILDLDLLQQRWLQIMDEEAPKESALLEKHRCNGFNSLH